MPHVRIGELELCYESIGQGAPLLMIMGLGAQLVFWPPDLCNGLVERGFRVIRFDNRDAGKSTRFRHLGVPKIRQQIVRWGLGRPIDPPYGLEAMADDAAGLLDALELPRAHVMGASLGGMIAQQLAIRHPQRVASLTSIMSHPGDRWSAIPRLRALRALLRPPPRTKAQAQDSWVHFFKTVGSPGFPFDEAGVRDRAGQHFDRGMSPGGTVRQMTAILAASDRRPALRSLGMPSLVMHGTADPLIPIGGGERTAAALPGAEFLRIEGMGHDLPRGVWPRLFDALARVTGVG
jgi:pimeloyl-ACP methyl ester carboxylesterase